MSQKAIFETARIAAADVIENRDSPAPDSFERLDRYELRRPLSKGGFATVYEAYDPRIKRAVAIKKCSSLDEENHERFFREAEIAGNLSHPNIVRIFDFGVAQGVPFIVQELLGGKDLADWIESGLELSSHDRVRILLQIASGAAYAHSRDVIHRDIKPANVRVLEDGSIKLLDFGVATIQEAPSDLTQAGTTVGTAAYLAPEQIHGARPTRATDIFSFGVLAYELLSGHRPFAGETLSAVLYQISHQQPEELRAGTLPGRLVHLVHRCLEKEAGQRPASFEEIIEELEEVLRDPRLAPPSAETVPIKTYPRGLPPSYQPTSAPTRPDLSLPLRPREASKLPDLGTHAPRPPLRDSSTRIQVARRPSRTSKVFLSIALLLSSIPVYLYFGGPLPVPVSSALAEIQGRLPAPLPAWFGLVREPELVSVPARVPPTEALPQVSEESAADPAPTAQTPEPAPDPVTAAIAAVESQKPPASPASVPPTRRVSSAAPATVFLPPSWHAQMMVSVDGGAFQPLDRRRTRQLRPGPHKLTFRLSTSSYKARRTLDITLEPAETRTIESPLAPPAALRVEVLPDTVVGRVEIDGTSLDLPLRAPQVLEPGSHRIALHPSPADPLGPLIKTVDLGSATVHVVTFDMRRRRAVLEVREVFEWDGE